MGNIVPCVGSEEKFREREIHERTIHFSHANRSAAITMRGTVAGLELERLLFEIQRQLHIDPSRHVLCGWVTGWMLDLYAIIALNVQCHVCRYTQSHHPILDARTPASIQLPLSLCHRGQGPT
jgi:hypothetical protein